MKPESANQMYLIVACCLTLLGVSSEHSLTTDNETKVPVVNEDNTEVTPTTEQLTDYASTRNVHLLSKTMESTNKTANSSNMNQRPEKNSEDNATEMPENTELTPMTERSTNHIITRDLQMDSRATESTNETANSIHIKQQSEKYSEGNEIELPVTNEVLTPTTELSIDYISTREVNLSSKTTESTSTTANSLEVNQYSEDHEIEKPEKTELTPTTERSTNHTSTRDLQMDSRATERTNKTVNSTQINQQPEKHSEGQNCQGIKYKGTFIETNLNFFFKMNGTEARNCLKSIIRKEIKKVLYLQNGNNNNQSCSNLTKDESFDLEYVQRGDNAFLWYPFIHCKNSTKCETVRMSFEECRDILDKDVARSAESDLRVTLMSSLPWKCQFQNDTRNYSKILAYLHIFNTSLLKGCDELLCESEYSHWSNITILRLNGSRNDTCRRTLNGLGSRFCNSKKNAFCFSAFKIPYVQRAIVFITNDNQTLSETEKAVIILREFTDQKDNGWCEHPLNYTTESRIIQNVYQNFFYCHGTPRNTTNTDAWITADLTEKESVVSLRSDLSYSIIPSNLMIQALISSYTMINTTVYNQFATSKIKFTRNTSQFNIPVFEGSHSEAGLLRYIETEELNVVTNKHFTKLADARSIWSQLNWIIFHNCSSSHDGDNKDLFLFLSNDMDFESICDDQKAVLLITVRREKVALLNTTRFRGCTDVPLYEKTNEHCQNLIKDGSDYETRFFQFLVHPLPLNKSAIQELAQQFKKQDENKIFTVDFGFNTHPQILGGISYLNKNFSPEITEVDEDLHLESLQKTLQIFVTANLTNNTECLKEIENGSFSLEIKENDHFDKVYAIGPVSTGVSYAACLKDFPLTISEDLKTVRLNKFWPTCMYNKLIGWKETGKHVPEWDYLPPECKALEITLFCVCCIITITTITGNILVIIIIICSKLIEKHAFMLYTSLALSDLLVGVTSALQALIDTYSLMNDQLTIYNLTELGPLENFTGLVKDYPKGFQDVRFQREGWPAFTGIAMNISIMTSLMSLALLGIDRLLMLKMLYFKNKHIICGIIIMWAWNIICAILISMRENKKTGGIMFVSSFDPITKLTLNIGNLEDPLSSVLFTIQLFIGGMAGIVIVTASIASIVIYRFKEFQRGRLEIMIHDQRRGEKLQVITRTFLMMVILFLVSCVPMASILIIKHLFPAERTTDFPFGPVFHFITWWLCVAGSSWNWLIYCFRGTYFQAETKKLWRKFLGPQ